MNGALDFLMVLAAVALAFVVAFRAGMRWADRRTRICCSGWAYRLIRGFPNSSPLADGVPGDNPAGVSIPPTTVPPAGVRLRLIDGSFVTVSSEVAARIAGAADFFPQYRGRS